MPFLEHTYEWLLLNRLAHAIRRKDAVLATEKCEWPTEWTPAQKYGEYLETELYAIPVHRCSGLDIQEFEFEALRATLEQTCTMLNILIAPELRLDLPMKGKLLQKSPYPLIEDLVEEVETDPESFVRASSSRSVFTLSAGDAEFRKGLDLMRKCNSSLQELAFGNKLPLQAPRRISQGSSFKGLRSSALPLLAALFKRFSCDSTHEVLLKLVVDPNISDPQSDLDLLLSTCTESDFWQKASFNLNEERDLPKSIESCRSLQELLDDSIDIRFQVSKDGRLSAQANNQGKNAAFRNRLQQSLLDLIQSGAFKQLSVNRHTHGSTLVRCSTREKRVLAVMLGYCLMDFYDSTLSPARVCFFISQGHRIQESPAFLRFAAAPSTSIESRPFRLGHPALLSLAKLLIEIELGESVDFEIKDQHYENIASYVSLVECLEKLEDDVDDNMQGISETQSANLLIAAIRGCLTVHKQLSRSLRRLDLSSAEAQSQIRKIIHREIIEHLEQRVPPAPRSHNKRTRSESPSPREKATLPPNLRKVHSQTSQLLENESSKEALELMALASRDPPKHSGITTALLTPNTHSGYLERAQHMATQQVPATQRQSGISTEHISGLNSVSQPNKAVASKKASTRIEHVPVEQLGLRELGNVPSDCEIDVIAVHGLGAIPAYTWKVRGKDSWLEAPDMLPRELPSARILRFGYDSIWFGPKAVKNSLANIAKTLKQQIQSKRKSCPNRPFLLIGHCFGGLIIQELLLDAMIEDQNLVNSCAGIVFLGTPHRGSSTFDLSGKLMGAIIGRARAEKDTSWRMEPSVLKALEDSGTQLPGSSDRFARFAKKRRIPIASFYELRRSDVSAIVSWQKTEIPMHFVVNETSAKLEGHPCFGLPLDHFELNKFGDPEDGNYRIIVETLQGWCRERIAAF